MMSTMIGRLQSEKRLNHSLYGKNSLQIKLQKRQGNYCVFEHLRQPFAQFGIPKTIVFDNGTVCCS